MPKRAIDFALVRTLALALPDVEESTIYGVSALKVRGRLLACPAINRSAEPNTLGVRVDFEQRAELIGADPDTYYVTDHYVDYPMVLVRLSRIHPDALADLLRLGWRFVTSQAMRRAARPSKAARPSRGAAAPPVPASPRRRPPGK